MSNKNTLRDIWETTDKKSMEVMKESGGMPPSTASSTITDFSTTPKGLFQQNTKQNKPNLTKANSPLLPEVPFYYKDDSSHLEDDRVSLLSIWSPTAKDKLDTKNKSKDDLLIDFTTTQDEIPQNTNDFAVVVNDKLSANNSVVNEGLLIDFDTPIDTTPQNQQGFPKPDSDDEISDSELSNNYGSDDSQDGLNNKSVIKYTAIPKEYRKSKSQSSSLSELSDITIKCISPNKELKTENTKPKADPILKGEEKPLVIKNIETNKQKSPDLMTENLIKKNYNQNCLNLQTKYKTEAKNHVHNNGYQKYNNNYDRYRGKTRRRPNRPTTQKISNLSLDNDDVLSISHANLTIQERDSTSGKTREKKIAFKTQEVIGKKGNRTQKITYVQGKIIEEADNSNRNMLKWNSNICDVKLQNRETVFHSNIPKFRFTDNSAPDYEYVPKCQPYLNESKSMNFYRNFMQPRNCANIKDNFQSRNRSISYNKPESDNIRHYNQNRRKQTKKEVLMVSGGRVVPNEIPLATEKKFDEKINSIVLCNEKFRKQQHIEEQLSWNIVEASEENNCENGTETEHHTEPKSIEDSKELKHLETHPKQVIEKSSQNRFGNVHGSEKENDKCSTKLEQSKTTPGLSKDLKESKPLRSILKQVVKTKPNEDKGQLDRFVFMRSLETTSESESSTQITNKTIDNSILEMEKKCSKMKCSIMQLKEVKAEKKYAFIYLVKEMADLIVGSHRATDVFRSFYVEWAVLRLESIQLLENVLKTTVDTKHRSGQIKKVADVFKLAMNEASNIPQPTASLGARIGSFISKLFGQEENKKSDIDTKEFEIKDIFQKDIDTTSYVYIYGVQCSTQFQETTTVIKELHRKIRQDTVDAYFSDKHVLEFLKEISENNIATESIFYRRLMLEYERMIKNSQSDESRAFVRIFKDMPDALRVIELLPWRFDPDGFENSIVNRAWENLIGLFYEPVNMDELVRNIQSCLFFLKKEKKILERNFKAFAK